MMKYSGLCIGGSRDGERISDIPGVLMRVQVPSDPGPIDFKASISDEVFNVDEYRHVTMHHYSRTGEHKPTCFWFCVNDPKHRAMDEAALRFEVLQKLVERYEQ